MTFLHFLYNRSGLWNARWTFKIWVRFNLSVLQLSNYQDMSTCTPISLKVALTIHNCDFILITDTIVLGYTYQTLIKNIKPLKSTKTVLIPVESLQLLRNLANPLI